MPPAPSQLCMSQVWLLQRLCQCWCVWSEVQFSALPCVQLRDSPSVRLRVPSSWGCICGLYLHPHVHLWEWLWEPAHIWLCVPPCGTSPVQFCAPVWFWLPYYMWHYAFCHDCPHVSFSEWFSICPNIQPHVPPSGSGCWWLCFCSNSSPCPAPNALLSVYPSKQCYVCSALTLHGWLC